MRSRYLAFAFLLIASRSYGQAIVGGGSSGGGAGGAGTVTSVDAACGTATASGSAITATGTIKGSQAVNAQTGTTYTYLDGDCGKIVTHTNGSAIAGTLPQAGASSQFVAGWYMDVQNRGAGNLTITPTTSTIDGAATLAVLTRQGVRIVSDGTNYFTQRGGGGDAVEDNGAAVVIASRNLTISTAQTLNAGDLQIGSGIAPGGVPGMFSTSTPNLIINPYNTGVIFFGSGLASFGGFGMSGVYFVNGSGAITSYNSQGTVGVGLPYFLFTTSQLDQTASIGTTNVLASPTAGSYRVNMYLMTSTAASSGSGCTVDAALSWTDPGGAKSSETQITGVDLTVVTNAGQKHAVKILRSTTAAITYTTTLTAGSCAGHDYNIYITAERLQ